MAGSKEIAGHISTALQTLGAQLDALLDVSKLDAGVVPVKRASFSLIDFLGRHRDEYQPLAATRGLALTMSCPPDAICETDEALLGRILRNLLENAIKYTPSGRIEINARLEGTKWLVSVQDTGIGLSPQDVRTLFQAFSQADNSLSRQPGGTGLGLVISKRLIEQMGGEIGVDSTPGEGSQFWISLSLPRAHDDAEEQPGAQPGREQQTHGEIKGWHGAVYNRRSG